MKILVINAGSSTLKFQFVDMENESVLAKGNVERINNKAFLRYSNGKEKAIIDKDVVNHKEALDLVLETLTSDRLGVIKDMNEINAFGHRVVNMSDKYFDPIVLNDEIIADFKTLVDFAPLHNYGAISTMEACVTSYPDIPSVAVFDTGFHKTMPEYVFRYGIPKRYYEDYKIRRYGAHGTSHKYVSAKCAEMLGKDIQNTKIITCHIGSGASICAVKNGECLDTSMGFTPLEGIMMNTRSGDIDPAVIEFICKKDNKTVSEVLQILNKQSGLLGVNGKYDDMRDILENLNDKDIALSFDMYCYRIKKYIGSYMAAMDGVDAIVFTAGVGEHTPEMREKVLQDMDFFGISIDHDKNYGAPRDEIVEISTQDSRVKVFVIPTDEEIMIARATMDLTK